MYSRFVSAHSVRNRGDASGRLRAIGRCLLLLVATMTLALSLPTTSHAFELLKDSKGRVLRWVPPTIRIYVNPNNVKGISPADVTKVFQKAIASWNSVQCSNFVGIFATTTKLFTKDNQTTISFPANFGGGGSIFQTQYYSNNKGNLGEVDIALNPNTQWALNPSGGGQDLESVAMAVIGTILGLASSKEPKATMGGNFLSGDISKRTLHPDDIAGICTLYPSGKPQCSKDTDCPTGLGCQAGKCVLKNPTPAANACKPCATNNDCGSSDLVCDLVGNGRHCLHKCTPDGLCPNGTSCSGNGVGAQCLPNTGSCPKSGCSKDADCGAGFKCKAGKCEPECSTDNDCTAPNVCNNGRCGPKGACTNDLDCSAGFLCKSGKCVENTTKQPCSNDNDCPNGFSCKNKFCERDGGGGCTDGATQPCSCPAGGNGTQTCANKQWGACQGCGGNTGCTDGATQPCSCPGGGNGTQTCANKQWGACSGCGGNKTCAPGSTQACVCTDGKKGAQTCSSDGTAWEACKCTGAPGICTSGQTQACVCSDGKSGTQSCNADGQAWGACSCGGGPPAGCTAGATQPCTCTTGGQGAQTCQANGTWAACVCSGPGPGDGGVTPTPDNGQPATKCTSHNECPTGQFCINNVCRESGGNDGGCGCEATSPARGVLPLFLVLIFLLGLSFQRRISR